MPNRSLVVATILPLLLLVACGSGGTGPIAPTDVTATPGPGYITITWQDNSDEETGFALYRSEEGNTVSVQQAGAPIAQLAANEESYVDLDVDLDNSYSYFVSALGVDGEESSSSASSGGTTSLVAGVDLMVGTFNLGTTGDLWTAFLFYLTLPEDQLTGDFVDVTVTGPDGWNGDEPLALDVPVSLAERGWASFHHDTPPAAGDFDLQVDGATATYDATASLTDETYRFPSPENVTVTDASASTVSATWNAAAGAQSYHALIRTADYSSYVASAYLTDSSHTFTEASLAPNSYRVEVVAYPVDLTTHPVKVAPYGTSVHDSEPPFDIE